MQPYIILFIIVNAFHISGGLSALNMKTIDSKKILHNVASCWLYLKENINDARSYERKIYLKICYNIIAILVLILQFVCTMLYNLCYKLHASHPSLLTI